MKIDDVPVKLGRCIRVQNTEKSQGGKLTKLEASVYVSIQVETDSDSEFCILLTETEHTDLRTVIVSPVFSDQLKAGHLYELRAGIRCSYLVKLQHWDGCWRVVILKDRLLQRGKQRAEKHPNTVTKKGIITDLLD